MLMPYWTNNCIDSMEGLLFESSATTPYHFLDQAELSVSPSDPMVGPALRRTRRRLRRRAPPDARRALLHRVLAVGHRPGQRRSRTHVDRQDQEVAVTGRPVVHLQDRLESDGPATHEPAQHRGEHHESRRLARAPTRSGGSIPKLWGTVAATTGPSNWPSGHERRRRWTRTPRCPRSPSATSRSGCSRSRSTSVEIGVPVLVKISYFPRWHATGATGPYRVSPNLMVVIPTVE